MQRLAYPIFALIFAGIFIPQYINSPSIDLTALYVAGYAVAKGMPEAIYAVHPDFLNYEAPAVLQQLKAEMGLAEHQTVPYIYPPLWAWLMAPIVGAVSHAAFIKVVLAVHVAMLTASVGLSWHIVRPNKLKFEHWVILGFAILALSAPAYQAMFQNQPQITTMFLVLLAFERYRSGAFAMAGTILAIAAAFKLSPVFLVLIFLLERNLRATVAFAATGAALGLASLAVAGVDLHLKFLKLLGRIDELTILDKTNYSPELLVFQLKGLITGDDPSSWNMAQATTWPEPYWLSVLMAALMLAVLAALILMRPRLVPGTAVPVLLLGFTLASALFGPISWAHYFILPLLLLPTMFHIVSPRSAWMIIITMLVLQSFPAYIVYYKLSTAFYVTTLMGVLCYLGLLIVLIGSVFRAVRFEPEVPLHFR